MEIVFLGTAGAEGIPATYCRCTYCMRVRQGGGKDQRTRAAIRIGEHYQIDFGPDTAWQLHREGLDIFELEHILITHTHDDHFHFEEIVKKSLAAETNEKPLHIYLSIPAKAYLERILFTFASQIEDEDSEEAFLQCYQLHGLEYFQRYQVGVLELETVKGSHLAEGEQQFSLNYLIHLPNGQRLLYAVDTGYYLDDSWAFLANRQADIVIMDCTWPGKTRADERPFGHHDGRSFIRTLERMQSIGFIGNGGRIFATHIDPHQGLFHDEIQTFFDSSPHKVTVAYDGLRI
jgi:phosphoribosyl 1,2-cyclic phosphate phosphodiesterase